MSITASELIGLVRITGAEESAAKLATVGTAVDGTGAKLVAFAAGATILASAALVGIGVESVKMAGDFQQSTNTLITSAGLSRTSIDAVRQGILNMSVDTATSWQDLTKGMFNVQSALHLGAGGLQVLKAAAEGAKAENSDLAQTTDVLTTAMVNYKISAAQAVPTMDSLIVTVAAGKMHMNDLTGSLRNVLPVAAAFHIHLSDVEGALATMANAGDRGTIAGTHLAMMFKMLSSPVGAAKKEMAAMGLDSIKLAETMRTSLPAALKMIQDAVTQHFKPGSVEYERAILAILGGSKSGVAGLEILNQGLKALGSNTSDAASALRKGSKDVENWSVIQSNFNFKMDAAKNAVEVFGISIGTKLLPVASQFMDWIAAVAVPNLIKFSDWFTNTAIPAMQQFAATVKTDVTDTITASISVVQHVVDWWNQWKDYIIAVGSAITVFFLPAIIQTGIQAVIAGGALTYNFIAAVIKTGIEAVASAALLTDTYVGCLILTGGEAWAAAGKLAVFTGAMITSGVEAVVAGGKVAVTYVGSLITAAATGQITAATLYASIIPALVRTGAAAWAAAGPFAALAATVIAVVAIVKYEMENLKGNVITNFNQTRAGATQMSYNMYKDTTSNAKSMATGVTNSAQQMQADATAAAQQMVDQTLNKFALLDNQGTGIVQHFGAAAMRVFDEMKSTGISDLSQLDASALSYLKEIQGYVDAMNGQLSLGASNAASRGLSPGQINMHAEGTDFAPGGLSLVGERGPELLNIPRGAQVIPNHQIGQISSSSSLDNRPININLVVDGRTLARVTAPHLVDLIRAATGVKF